MKYPIDPQTTETMFGHLITHERSQRQLITALSGLLMEAMSEPGVQETDWHQEAKKLFKMQRSIKTDHETRIFNARNGHQENSAISVAVDTPIQAVDAVSGPPMAVPGAVITPEQNHNLNKMEESFGGELSEEELERMFQEKPKAVRDRIMEVDLSKKNPFKGMTLQEIEEWEAKQNNSNDIYKIKARIQNLAVGISGGNLTPVGEMMVNSFVHVVKDLYEFAEYLPDKEQRIRLIERIRKHESMPGTLIAAASAGVRVKK